MRHCAQAPINVRGLSVPARADGDGWEMRHGDVHLRCFRQERPLQHGRPWLGAVRLVSDDHRVHAYFDAEARETPSAAMNAAIDAYERVMRYLGSRSAFVDPCPTALPFEPGPRADSDVGPPDALFPSFDIAL